MKILRLALDSGSGKLRDMKRLFAAGVFIALINIAHADDTTLNNGKDGPEPLNVKAGEESPVRMVSEQLEIHFGVEKTSVVARFHFLNPTTAAIHQTIGFPDEGLADEKRLGKDAEGVGFPIENMKTFVDGKETASKVEFGRVKWAEGGVCWLPASESDPDGFSMAWHTLTVDFPAGKEVVVERRYTTEDSVQVGGVHFFSYTVHTGSAWSGKIGKLEAKVILEGGMRVDDLLWDSKVADSDDVVSPKRAEWKIPSATLMMLEWDDFKPSEEKGKQFITISTLSEGARERLKKIRASLAVPNQW